LKHATQGARHQAPEDSSPQKHLPVTLAHLKLLRSHLNLNNTFDAAIFAAATVAFWCQCRIGEVCVDSQFNACMHASRDSPQKGGLTVSNVAFYSFWAPRTKTKPWGEFIMWTDSGCDCSAHWAFKNHLKVNRLAPSSSHLFGFEGSDGIFYPMKRSWFISRCNEVWSSNGEVPLTGHSFRIGGTTHLLLMGMDPFIVMVQGRWKSAAFLDYWHSCEEIIPTCIGFSQSSKQSILTTMCSFKQRIIGSL